MGKIDECKVGWNEFLTEGFLGGEAGIQFLVLKLPNGKTKMLGQKRGNNGHRYWFAHNGLRFIKTKSVDKAKEIVLDKLHYETIQTLTFLNKLRN